MTDNPNYTIRPYTRADNAALAVMWNESDDQWPGTFTGGVPFTAERMREWMDREVGLSILVVDESTRGCIVGYGATFVLAKHATGPVYQLQVIGQSKRQAFGQVLSRVARKRHQRFDLLIQVVGLRNLLGLTDALLDTGMIRCLRRFGHLGANGIEVYIRHTGR